MDKSFSEQVKDVLKRRKITIKALADMIEESTGMKMSRQNLTQRLSRDNFQEQDMHMIARVLGCSMSIKLIDPDAQVVNTEAAEIIAEDVKNSDTKQLTVAAETDADNTSRPVTSRDLALKARKEREEYEERKRLEEERLRAEEEERNRARIREIAKRAVQASHNSAGSFLTGKPAPEWTEDKQEPPLEELWNEFQESGVTAEEIIAEVSETVASVTTEAGSEEVTETRADIVSLFEAAVEGISEEADGQQVFEIPVSDEDLSADLDAVNGSEVEILAEAEEAEAKAEKTEDESEAEEETETRPRREVSIEDEFADSAQWDLKFDNNEVTEEPVVKGLGGLIEASRRDAEKPVENNPDTEGPSTARKRRSIFRRKEESLVQAARRSSEADAALRNTADMGIVPDSFRKSVINGGKEAEAPAINPRTGEEYESNVVRSHPRLKGYIQVYDRTDHKWIDMTEWAFLGFQEKKKAMLGSDYKPPIYLD